VEAVEAAEAAEAAEAVRGSWARARGIRSQADKSNLPDGPTKSAPVFQGPAPSEAPGIDGPKQLRPYWDWRPAGPSQASRYENGKVLEGKIPFYAAHF
jgi:hypothetical protein